MFEIKTYLNGKEKETLIGLSFSQMIVLTSLLDRLNQTYKAIDVRNGEVYKVSVRESST